MTDAVTGQSRGYGFVRFAEEGDQQRALVEMQGVYCGNRPMRISTATPKTRFVSLFATSLVTFEYHCTKLPSLGATSMVKETMAALE